MLVPRFAIILPACNEAACLGAVLEELIARIDPRQFVIAVGANDCSDETAEIARQRKVLVGETSQRGYGYGCQAAISVVQRQFPSIEALIFMAADGASDPADLPQLLAAFEEKNDLVLGQRNRSNRRSAGLFQRAANRTLGFWCSLLAGRRFSDLGPFRLISCRLFDAMEMQEWTFGWTIEAQIKAARLNARIAVVDVVERPRLAGNQKVSGVSLQRSADIGWQIFCAGWRCRWQKMESPVGAAWKKRLSAV